MFKILWIIPTAMLASILACGGLAMLFEDDVPKRDVKHIVKFEEFIIGTWEMTEKSNNYVENQARRVIQNDVWGINAPWRKIELRADGSCYTALERSWLGKHLQEIANKDYSACSWNLKKETVMVREQNSDVFYLGVTFHYSGKFTSWGTSFYIAEENDKLVLWSFIGDPDDYLYQDFIKVK
jgi:hypothetical protein